MTPVPLPPAHDVWTACDQAYLAWGEGRVDFGSLVNGAIVLADGTRCPVSESPHRLPVEVVVPPGQPYVRAPDGRLAETGAWITSPWALGIALALILAGVLFLVFTRPREETPMGAHSWLGDRDLELNGDQPDDEQLLAAVTGMGEERAPAPEAYIAAVNLPLDTDEWDLRGERDRDPQAEHPWRRSGDVDHQ